MRLRRGFVMGIVLTAIGAAWGAPPKPPAASLTAAERLHIDAKPVSSETFDKQTVGDPKGFRFFSLAGETLGKWVIKEDFQAVSRPHVLAHTGDTPGQWDFAMLEGPPRGDGEITFSFKAIQGSERLSGGVVWRYQDPKSFYLLELDSEGDALRLYCMKKGKAKCIDTQAVIVTPYRWHTFRLDFIAQTYSVYWDDELAMAGHDKTWLAPGAVGLVSDAGSEVSFDNWILRQ
jgi:hypothetical protein